MDMLTDDRFGSVAAGGMAGPLPETLLDDERARAEELRARMQDAAQRRLPWEAKLGASLFEATRDNLALREGREELYAELEALDLEQAGHQRELDALIAAAQEREERKRLVAQVVEGDGPVDCPFCGRHIEPEDRFCAGCGRPVEEVRRELAARMAAEQEQGGAEPVCPACGASVCEGDRFCMMCGAKLA